MVARVRALITQTLTAYCRANNKEVPPGERERAALVIQAFGSLDPSIPAKTIPPQQLGTYLASNAGEIARMYEVHGAMIAAYAGADIAEAVDALASDSTLLFLRHLPALVGRPVGSEERLIVEFLRKLDHAEAQLPLMT